MKNCHCHIIYSYLRMCCMPLHFLSFLYLSVKWVKFLVFCIFYFLMGLYLPSYFIDVPHVSMFYSWYFSCMSFPFLISPVSIFFFKEPDSGLNWFSVLCFMTVSMVHYHKHAPNKQLQKHSSVPHSHSWGQLDSSTDRGWVFPPVLGLVACWQI